MLRPGSKVGHYDVLSTLGRGGMGVVWRARDTVLGRDVAIKTLPEDLAGDARRLARLTREAGVLASLNHPSIGVIHGLEESDGLRFLVLELVDGETLEERLAQGRIPTTEALKLALQMTEAVEAAHAKEVVHRDLKPSNIKITSDGRIKVLDFGLAKTLAESTESVTQTIEPTLDGAVVGTPAYMSPEQARGEPASTQADIWSLGVVLYEMFTGRAPFARATTAETLASLLHTEPDFSALPADLPASARRAVQRCLRKDRRARLQHMGDVRIALEDALAEPGPAASATPSQPPHAAGRWRAAALVAFAVIAVMAAWMMLRPAASPPSRQVRATLRFAAAQTSFPGGSRNLAISADGSLVAFTAAHRIWLRRMDQTDAAVLQTAQSCSNPFFSPDGRWIGLFNDSALVKVPVEGGPLVKLAPNTDRPRGAVWLDDDTIVFATTEGLFQVPAAGGEPQLLKRPNRDRGELAFAWPQAIPGTRAILITIVGDSQRGGMRTARLDLTTLEHTVILESASSATVVATGHVVFASGSALKAVEMHPDTGAIRGEPLTLADVSVAVAADNGAANFAVAHDGTLVYTSQRDPGTLNTLAWLDRHGREEAIALEPARYQYPRLSPDGRRIAVEKNRDGQRDIWIVDLERLTQVQLTDGPTEDLLPVWSPDGRRLWFSSDRSGNFDIYSQPTDGASPARVEFAQPESQLTQAFTPDGRQLLVYERFRDTNLMSLAKPDRLEPLLTDERFDKRLAQVSPDGKWIAYESNESGERFEIMLRPFPNVGDRREKISINGGRFPHWGPRGSQELYYVDLDGAMMAARITLSPTLTLGGVQKLFDWVKPPEGRNGLPYDVSPKDGRFLVTRLSSSGANTTQVSVVLNWLETLRR